MRQDVLLSKCMLLVLSDQNLLDALMQQGFIPVTPLSNISIDPVMLLGKCILIVLGSQKSIWMCCVTLVAPSAISLLIRTCFSEPVSQNLFLRTCSLANACCLFWAMGVCSMCGWNKLYLLWHAWTHSNRSDRTCCSANACYLFCTTKICWMHYKAKCCCYCAF